MFVQLESYAMYFPDVTPPHYSSSEPEYSGNSSDDASAPAATSRDTMQLPMKSGSSQSGGRYSAQRFGSDNDKKRDEYFKRSFGHAPTYGAGQESARGSVSLTTPRSVHPIQPTVSVPYSGQYSGQAGISYESRSSSLTDAQRYAQEHGQQYGPEYMKKLEAYFTEHLAPRSVSRQPVIPDRSSRTSADVGSPERTNSVSRQTYASAYAQGLRIPSDVMTDLQRYGELPLDSYTFINGIQLGASATALPHYLKLRKVLETFPGGPERIALLESPSRREDLTLLVTTRHKNYHNVTPTFLYGGAHQSIVHFDPTHGYYASGGKRNSPMITCFHEIEHAYQFLCVSRGDYDQSYLSEKVNLFGEWHDRCEQLAVEQENKLAQHLGQGAIRAYGSAGEYHQSFLARAFDSVLPA